MLSRAAAVASLTLLLCLLFVGPCRSTEVVGAETGAEDAGTSGDAGGGGEGEGGGGGRGRRPGRRRKLGDLSEITNADASGGPVLLSHDFAIGASFVKSMQMTQTMKMTVAGHELDQTTRADTVTAVEVGTFAGLREIRMTVEHLVLDIDMMGQSVSFDSGNPPNDGTADPTAQNLTKIVGHESKILLDSGGNVAALSGHLDAYTTSSGESIGSTRQLEQFIKIIKVAPAEPISPGQSFTFDGLRMDDNAIYEGEGKYHGTVTHDGEEVAAVSLDGTWIEDADYPQGGGNSNTRIVGGTIKVHVFWDATRNVARTIEVHQCTSIETGDPLQVGNVLEVPLEWEMKIKLDPVE